MIRDWRFFNHPAVTTTCITIAAPRTIDSTGLPCKAYRRFDGTRGPGPCATLQMLYEQKELATKLPPLLNYCRFDSGVTD